MNLRDGRGANLPKIIADEKAEGIVFSQNHDIAHGVPADQLNALYNACDVTFIPTTAEGYCVPAQESMAAGTPVVGTRTTALAELLENGGGIAVDASDYFIADDAANVRRHIISIPKSIEALRKILEDSEYRENLSKKGLEFVGARTWDFIGRQFDELVRKTLDKRVSVIDSFKPDKDIKILFNRPYGSAGDILLTTSITRAFKKKYSNASIVYSIPKEYIELLENNEDIDNIIPFEYMWEGSNFENKGQVRIAKFDMFGVEDKVESALIPRVNMSRQEIFANHCNIDLGDKYLPSYRILDSEREWASEYIGDDKNYKIAIKIDAESQHQSVSLEMFSILAKNLLKAGNSVYAFIKDRDHVTKKDWDKYCPDEVKTFYFSDHEKPYRKSIALLHYMDLVVSPEGSFCHFAGMLHKKMVVLFGPTDVKQRLKHYDGVYSVVNKECQFLPCWRHGGVACRLTGRKDFSKCLMDIQAGAVLAQIMKAKKEV
jgi:ADP-heptose:LPS heptosyltransferase